MNNDNAYMKKRKSVMDGIFRNISLCTIETGNINIDTVENVLQHLKKRRPLTDEHLSLKEFEKYFNSPKEYDKFIGISSKVKDFYFKHDLINTGKYKIFLKVLDFKESVAIFEKLIEKNISGHNFVSNIPRQIKHPQKWGSYVLRILDYSINEETLFKLLIYSNYTRLLDSNNKNELLNELAYLETTKSLSLNNDSAQNPYMLLKDLEGSQFLRFSKNTSIITSIGSETTCCFKKGGAGESVMMISLKSPIAAIIFGEKYDRTKWFAYIWEMVEYNEETKMFDIQLILDNIESNRHLNINDYNEIKTTIDKTNLYNKVYLGYLRNDIDLPMDEIGNSKKLKPSNITFFDKEIERYSRYDDSRYIYTVLERETNNEFSKFQIDLGEYHRIKYLTNYIEKSNLDDKLIVDREHKLYTLKFTKSFKLEDIIDLEKSYICRNDQSISEFEMYDKEGNLFASYKI